MTDWRESGTQLALDFNKLAHIGHNGQAVIPVVVQHAHTKEVLILAYTNQEALTYTVTHRVVAFWSTSRRQLWVKGKTSGDFLNLVEIRVNCEQNSLLYLVLPEQSGVCHVTDVLGHTRPSCFYRTVVNDSELKFL